ncbi:sirohydrochlorin chelatase [Virgibacillus sp. NKC19-16]|uniref:sirohydrochlorin chelatase n=1 Tax=Virgibacillus salidurans TaxID=2831673 RepID=UPI001F35979A|nr:sirohydrochlorin chelatase [Virgibacillus sp. NKC19-16]UJL47713.1 sirohydrochlorin chelatase [Virgibacillus sp. NKC19-16]
MQGVLYVSHGSRVPEAIAEAFTCINSVKRQIDVSLQEICFLELAGPTVEQGIEMLVNQGASRISIIPVLLLSAGHYYSDIPEEVNRAKEKYSSITFTYGQPLGVQDRFIDVLAERIKETHIPVNPDAKILLVGRGSRNPQTKRDMERIGGKLQTRMKFSRVDVCFLAACNPSFEEAIQSSLTKAHSQIFIVPYLWFTGVLMHYLEEKISELNNSNKDVLLCRQLGDHPAMKQALKERVYETFDKKDA